MTTPKTEERQNDSIGFKSQTTTQMSQLLLKAQLEAVECLASCSAEIERGAQLMASSIRAGGRLVYCGAGSSGLMALADSLELSGTFGIDPRQIHLMMAGGKAHCFTLPVPRMMIPVWRTRKSPNWSLAQKIV